MAFDSRIVYLTGSLEAGGLERFVSKVSITGKKEHRFEPVIICLSKRSGIFLQEVTQEDILVLAAPTGWQRNLGALLQLGKLIRKQNPIVVHSQVNFSIFQQWLATLFFSKARFMVTERNCYPLTGWDLLRRRLQFHFLRIIGVHYSGNSVEVVRYLAHMMRYPERKIPVIPNGIEIPLIDPLVRSRTREKHVWKAEDFVIGYISRFAEHKGQKYFMQVMEELHHHLGKQLKVCFIGDGPLYVKMEKYARSSKMADQIIFLGILNNVNDYYQAFDCTALLSDYEGMPNVVLEAMAYGLPVIANPVGNVVELFEQGGGMVNYSHDPVQTAGLFLELAKNSPKRESIGTLAKEKIRSSFSMQHTLNLLVRFYGTR